MPNTPNPDVNTVDVDTDDENRTDIESISENDRSDGSKRDNVPIEEPPDEQDKPPIDEDIEDDMERIVW